MPPSSRQIHLEKGRFLFLQGAPSDSFYVLKKGVLEVLVNEGSEAPDEETVRREGRRIRLLDRPNSPFGEIGTLEESNRTASIRALEPSELIWVAGGKKALVEWVRNNLQAGLLVVRSLEGRVIENQARWGRIEWLSAAMAAYIENFTILYAIFNNRVVSPKTPFGRLIQEGRALLSRLDQKSPPPIRDVERNVPPKTPPRLDAPFPEIELAHFFHTILHRPDAELEWLVTETAPPHPLMFMTERLAETLPRMTRELHSSMLAAEEIIGKLFGENGLIRAFAGLRTTLNDEQWEAARPFLESFLRIARDCRDEIVLIWGETFPALEELHRDIDLLERTSQGETPSSTIEASGASERPTVEARFNLRLALDLIRPDSMEEECIDLCLGLRKAEPAAIYAAYWRLYPLVWKVAHDRAIPELIAFLRYGIARSDGAPLPDEAFQLDPSVSGPVLYADQWLARIYRRESPPSRNDLGQNYDEVLATLKQERYSPSEPDAEMDFVRYEIDQMMSRAARGFSAGRGEQAILRRTPEELTELKTSMLTPARIAEALVRLIRLDFTPFVRDVRILLEERSEFLPKDVLPFMIILPAAGDRAVSWQEYEGRSKDTPGRLLFPLLSDTGLFDLIIAVVAKHRWELAKAVAGSEWMNPAGGGLTGRYYDYVTFFRKNPELSDEQKQKLIDVFANISMDADKFAIEYALWIKYESQGIQRLNRVARRIFAEFCPFDLETRKRLVRQPAFTEILRKDSNKRLKRRQEIERRIYKLERNSVEIGDAFELILKINQEIPE